MVITIDGNTQALVYELALITAIFGLDWIMSAKMVPCPTLSCLALIQIDASEQLRARSGHK